MIDVVEEVVYKNDPNAGKKKKTPSAMWTMMKDKALDTGVQGVPNIGRAKNKVRKFFWILVVIGGTLVLTWQVTLAVIKYYKYPVKTQILHKKAGQLVFPAVTICNLNPLRLNLLSQAGNMLDGFKQTSAAENNTKPANFDDWSSEEDYDKESSEFESYQSFLMITAQLTPDQRRAIGHQLETMLLSCTWNGMRCSPKNFTRFNNHLYGNCFTFNSNNINTSLIVSKPGQLYGLKLELYVEQDEYIESLSDAAGMRILVHNQTEMPFPEDEGFSVSPGSKTSVGLGKVNVIRASAPHGSCVTKSKAENAEVNAFLDEVSTIGYTSDACRKTCYQVHLMKDCGCYDTRYPNYPDIKPYMNITNITTMLPCRSPTAIAQGRGLCEEKTMDRYMQGTLGCNILCAFECYQSGYPFSISQAEWPSVVKEAAVMRLLMDKSEALWEKFSNGSSADDETFVRRNALKIEVYFKDLDYQEVVTEPSYEVSDLLSDLGGQAGLWLGVSVIAFFEFIELFFDVICVAVGRRKNKLNSVETAEKT